MRRQTTINAIWNGAGCCPIRAHTDALRVALGGLSSQPVGPLISHVHCRVFRRAREDEEPETVSELPVPPLAAADRNARKRVRCGQVLDGSTSR